MIVVTNLLLLCILFALVPELADVLGMIALALIGLAVIGGGALYLIANPHIATGLGVFALIVVMILAGVVGLALLHNKLVARFGQKRSEWIAIGLFFLSVPTFIGIALTVACIADAIHGPYT